MTTASCHRKKKMIRFFSIASRPFHPHLYIILYACLLLTGCINSQESTAVSWPSLGSPCNWMNVDTSQLTPANTSGRLVHLDPYFSSETPDAFFVGNPLKSLYERELHANVELQIYPHLTVEGHYFGTGTHVFYLPEDGLYYLWGDDYMSHFDGMVGPFTGNPRLELSAAASPSSWQPRDASVEGSCE